MESADVIIVGGGIAGVRAAIDLTDRRRRVLLFERSPSLGGRAGAHQHGRDGLIDVGQHVYMGCCREYRRLLADLGTAHLAPLSRRLDLELIDANPPRSRRQTTRGAIKTAPLPYPLSLAVGLLRYVHLARGERWAAIGLMMRAQRDWRAKRDELEQITFADWLHQNGCTSDSRAALWDPLIVATLNASPERVEARAGVMVLVKALGSGGDGAAIGIPRAPLSQLLQPLAHRIAPLGVVQTSAPVARVVVEGGRATGVSMADGRIVRSRTVILATAHLDVPRLLSDPTLKGHPFFARLDRLTSNPIVNVHFWFDRPVTRRPMTGFIRSPLQWLFDLTTLYGAAGGVDPGSGHHYALSLSDAADLMERPKRLIVAEAEREIRRLLPGAREARLLKATVRKMRHATFGCEPGHRTCRPGHETPVTGLYLAGDYTQSEWPSTMEAAALSGRACAREVDRFLDRSGASL